MGNTLFPIVLIEQGVQCYGLFMDYRGILKNQLQRRQSANPRYSLRSFAKKLALSPSKVSELLAGKKRLSVGRAELIAEKLGLADKEKELFVLSARLESSSKKIDKKELQSQIQSLTSQINAGRTTQRNAWYFGAVKALEDQGLDSKSLHVQLDITELQVENAKRFINRIKRFHPDRQEFSFEPVSILKKIEDEQYADAQGGLDADFLFLTEEQAQVLQKKIIGIVRTIKSTNKNISPYHLSLVHWGVVKLIKK